MGARHAVLLRCVAFALCLAAGALSAQQPLGPGPAWRGPVRPTGHNDVFATGDGCAMCHSAAERAVAMRSPTGDDVSPHGLWEATVMANSFRDPYWRAAVAREVAAAPDQQQEIEALCLRCHAPMHHHSRRLGGEEPVGVAAAAADPLARDGVSCALCHQIAPEQLGDETSFAGKVRIGTERRIYGPFADPASGPMRMMARYEVTHGAHVQRAALCATCHTLSTNHQGATFPEQTPYLEWRNSVFNDEAGATDESRTCQQCHMQEFGPTRIARNPGGRDFVIQPRGPYRGHGFVGGNAFLLGILADHREALGVEAPVAALRRSQQATRRFLADETVKVAVSEPVRKDGFLHCQVRVENRTGHKFPTGYPARRAWLHLSIRAGNQEVFECGGYTVDGHIAGIADQLRQPHLTRVETAADVPVWELVALDPAGEPTTSLVQMQRRGKDNRLLPRGWRRDGPHAAETAPIGVGNDLDFTAGGDTVDVAVPLPAGAGRVTVVAWVHYQTIPAHWVEPLRAVAAEECRQFVAIYDAADKTPETIGVGVASEPR